MPRPLGPCADPGPKEAVGGAGRGPAFSHSHAPGLPLHEASPGFFDHFEAELRWPLHPHSMLPVDERLRRLKLSLSAITSQYEENVQRLIDLHLCTSQDRQNDAVFPAATAPLSQPVGDRPSSQKPLPSELVCVEVSAEHAIDLTGMDIDMAPSPQPITSPARAKRSAPPSVPPADMVIEVSTEGSALGIGASASASEAIPRHASSALKIVEQKSHRSNNVMVKRDVELVPVSKRTKVRMEQDLNWRRKILASKHYEICVMFFVTFNAALIGYQVQHYALQSASGTGATSDAPAAVWERVLEAIFLLGFTLELVVRIQAYGRRFFTSTDWNWNVFDFLVVSVMWVESIFTELAIWDDDFKSNAMFSQMSTLRVLRVMRVVRILRVIRVLKFFRELRLMLSSILNSALSLFWAMVSLSLMFYIFGLSLTQGTVDFLNDTDAWRNPKHQSLHDHFGRLDYAALALFEGMSGGISWGELLDELHPLPWNYEVLFLLFISLAVLAVLNIVTGVFVQTAMERSQHDSETLIQDAMASKHDYLAKIQMVFMEMDTNNSGTLTMTEFEEALTDERLGAYFDALGLDLEELDTLFVLLDRDQEGAIDIEEFLAGCLKLKGEAKGLDMAIVQYESKWLMHNVNAIVEKLGIREGDASHPGSPMVTSRSAQERHLMAAGTSACSTPVSALAVAKAAAARP